MISIIFIIFLALIFIGFIFSPFLQPEVWVEKNGIKVRKYLKVKIVEFDHVASLAMTTIGGGSNDFSNGDRIITIKIKLVSGKNLVLNSFSHGVAEKKMAGFLSGFKPNFKKLFSSSRGFDEKSLLLSPEEIKEIISRNKNIKIDEFISSYLETGNCSKFLEVVEGY